MIAGARSVPCADATSTTSPCAMPSVRGGLRVDLDPAAPHRRRHRIRHLLQPRQVRERAVEERLRRVRQEVERILRRRRRRTAARRTPSGSSALLRAGRRAQPRSGRQRSPPAALLLRRRSTRRSSTRRGSAEIVAVSISSKVSHGRSSGFAACRADLEQHVRRRARLVQRPHRRRRDAGHGDHRSRFGRGVDPRFEERVVRQDQIGEHARLVEEAPERQMNGTFSSASRPATPSAR